MYIDVNIFFFLWNSMPNSCIVSSFLGSRMIALFLVGYLDRFLHFAVLLYRTNTFIFLFFLHIIGRQNVDFVDTFFEVVFIFG